MQKLAIGFLFDDTLDSDAGVAQYVKTVGAWLSARGHKVTYLVGQTKMKTWAGGDVCSMSRNRPVTFNGNNLSIPLPASAKNIKRVLLKYQFDILHVQVPYSPLMSGRVLTRAKNTTAVVGTFHILPVGRLATLGSRLLHLTYFGKLGRFDSLLSVSGPAKDFASKYYRTKSRVVPNVVELKKFAKKGTKSVVIADRIVFLGRLVPRKGCYELLEAFYLLHQWKPSAKLVIAGDGPERQRLEQYVKNHNLGDAVDFLGYISEDQKPKLLASAQVACFPAIGGESFGIVLIEAMAANAGVVLGGNNPGYSSVLQAQPELLIDPHESVVFARRLELLLNDVNLSKELNSWQKHAVKQYDINLVGPKLEKIYFEAVSKHKKSDKILSNE